MPGYDSDSRLVQREAVLLVVLTVVAAVAFVFTREVAQREHAVNQEDAAHWFATGERQLRAGQTTLAIASLRQATSHDRNNHPYALTLARALAANGQQDEARRALLVLRERVPDDPDVSIALARLATARGDVSEAQRFYQNALYGIWPPGREDERLRLRVELIRFLLQHDERGRALSEIVALSTNLPEAAEARIEAGQLFLAAGDAGPALDEFGRALKLAPGDAKALAGAGEASFALADYAGARRYLARVEDLPGELAALRDVSRMILEQDPLEPRLTLAARGSRLRAVVTRAIARLDECLVARPEAEPTLTPAREALTKLIPRIDRPTLRDQPELVGEGVDLVYQAEREAAMACGEPQGLDRALLLIGERHQESP